MKKVCSFISFATITVILVSTLLAADFENICIREYLPKGSSYETSFGMLAGHIIEVYTINDSVLYPKGSKIICLVNNEILPAISGCFRIVKRVSSE